MIQGIGVAFIPRNLDENVIDEVIEVKFLTAYSIIFRLYNFYFCYSLLIVSVLLCL